MSKQEQYREKLLSLADWDAHLLAESGLPGPRGNIELAQVVADQGDLALFQRYCAYDAKIAPVNSPYEFLAFCGVIGLGRLLAEGQTELLPALHSHASDPRWRVREGVAMALQRWGDRDMAALIHAMGDWGRGTLLVQRAAAAALCEPRLLHQPQQAAEVLQILDEITARIVRRLDRRDPDFLALKKGLGYCWSVAVAALPAQGKPLMEKWLVHPDKDIQWIMRENLKKNRLARVDAEWVSKWQARPAG